MPENSYRLFFAFLVWTLAVTGIATAETADLRWAVHVGTDYVDAFAGSHGKAVVTDESGNVYVTGYFSADVTFGDSTVSSTGYPEISDIYLAKYDTDGNFLWVRTAGGTGFDQAYDVAIDAEGDLFVTGDFSETANFGDSSVTSYGGPDMFLAKYDGDGEILWVKHAGSSDDLHIGDWGWSVAVDPMGNCIVAGRYEATAVFGDTLITDTNGKDAFVAKYSNDGELIWVRSARTDPVVMREKTIATDSNNNVYMTGAFRNAALFDGQVLTSVELSDIFVVKYDSNGNIVWLRRAGGGGHDHGRGVTTDTAGDCIVAGLCSGEADFGDTTVTAVGEWDVMVAKYDTDGNIVWVRTAGKTAGANHEAEDVCVDGLGGILVSGAFRDTVSFAGVELINDDERDAFVVKYDGAGDLIWVMKAGGVRHEVPLGIVTDTGGDLFITGYFDNEVVFGGDSLDAIGVYDNMFVAKLDLSPGTGIQTRTRLPGLELEPNYPNPFNPVTLIRYRVPVQTHVDLTVFGPRGERVRTLVDSVQRANTYVTEWEGRDERGQPVASGVYFCRLRTSVGETSVKMTLLR